MPDAKLTVKDANGVLQQLDNESVTTSVGSVLRQRVEAPESDAILSSIETTLSGTLAISAPTDYTASGSITGNNQTLSLTSMNGVSTAAIEISGTWSGFVSAYGRVDGANWVQVQNLYSIGNGNTYLSVISNGLYTADIAGFQDFQISSGPSGWSGTATVTLRASAGTPSQALLSTVASNQTGGTQKTQIVDSVGHNALVQGNSLQVAVTNGPNISNITGTVSLPTGASTAANQVIPGSAGTPSSSVASVQGIAGMTALKVDPSGVTSPVSGTVTVNAGTNTSTAALATAANQTNGTQQTKIVDGSGNVIASTANALNVNITGGATGTPTGPAGTPNANVVSVQGITSMTPIKVDGSAVTQPVSGTVTASAGTNLNTSALATSANLTAGTMKTQVVDGSGNVIGSTSNALNVNITGGSTGTPTGPAGTPNTNVVTVQGIGGATGIPVTGTFWQTTQPISAVSLPLPTGAAQDGVDATGITAPTGGSGIRGWLSGMYNVLLNSPLPTGGNTIGAVSITNFPASQTNGALELGGNLASINAQLLATGTTDSPQFVSIAGDPSGDFAGLNLIEQVMNDGTGLYLNTRAIGGGTPGLPVRDTMTIQGVTGMTPVQTQGADIVSTGSIITQNLTSTGAATPGSAVTISGLSGTGTMSIQISGVYTGVLTLQASDDGVNWVTISAGSTVLNSTSGNIQVTFVSGSNGIFITSIAGHANLRVTGLAAMTGAAVITLRASSAVAMTNTNLTTILGQGIATGGANGVLSVGGNIATGTAATANPVPVGGTDTGGLTRRLLLDTNGVLSVGGTVAPGIAPTAYPAQIGGADSYGFTRRLLTDPFGAVIAAGQQPIASSTFIPSFPISSFEYPGGFLSADGVVDALNKTVMLLTEISFLIKELPNYLNQGLSYSNDDMNTFRSDPSNYF